MVEVKLQVTPYVAEYISGKYYDEEIGCVRFPSTLDISVLIYDLLAKRPTGCVVDRGNLTIALPCRRQGKSPQYYNYLCSRSQKLLAKRMRTMMWAELHELMDENKHLRGIQFKETVFCFMRKYGIESISEDALLKNYQRWRDRIRRNLKRGYSRKQYVL